MRRHLMSLSGKVVVVTGATGALGMVVTKTLLGHGAHVVSTYRSEERQKQLGDFVGRANDILTSVQADVTDGVSVQALFQKVVDKYGRVDILLNIVGAYKGESDIASTEESDWDFMMDVDLKSAFLCSKAALPHMMRQNYGKIVSVSSRTAVEKRF
jgi:NAD(P)-dependent dehydrogenase (short-subunit alcohol dehydrogenase family)